MHRTHPLFQTNAWRGRLHRQDQEGGKGKILGNNYHLLVQAQQGPTIQHC